MTPTAGRLSPGDPNSYARPDIAKVVNIELKWDVDFRSKAIHGSVILTVIKVDPAATHLVLDCRYLDIKSVTNVLTNEALPYTIGPESYVGSKFEVQLPQTNENEVKVKVDYQTTEKCTALQWLNPNQTASKTHPYMFSQCQAIHARSLVPCQDTPTVKTPYTAEVSAPSDLVVLMSAIRQGEPTLGEGGKKVYKYHQNIPIQSYLIAIAVGNVESRKIGPRSHVWSEKEFVDKAAFDFSETEAMLQIAEKLCGPYVWGIYDILVLPPSFPFGGMENPCLTFATPTLLTGDRSLSDVIAHEISHSWTGNLVSNKTYEHIWLNEGFTMYNEYKIIGRLHGEKMRHFSAIAGWSVLTEEISHLGANNPLTSLVVDLDGVDPDDAFSSVPYEKGAAFLWYLEETVGGADIFEAFLRAYYENFKFQSIDSYDFKKFFLDYFKDNQNVTNIDWDTWFKAPGMPKHKPNYDETLAKACKELAKRWVASKDSSEGDFSASDLKDFTPNQVMEFLAQLLEEEPLSVATLSKMEKLYSLNSVTNSEIKFRWIRLGLRGHWEDAIPRAIQMITEQGRMKYVRPIYRDLYAWDKTREVAVSTFEKNKPEMMHVAIQGVEHDLKLRP